jgi:hypothetical protein
VFLILYQKYVLQHKCIATNNIGQTNFVRWSAYTRKKHTRLPGHRTTFKTVLRMIRNTAIVHLNRHPIHRCLSSDPFLIVNIIPRRTIQFCPLGLPKWLAVQPHSCVRSLFVDGPHGRRKRTAGDGHWTATHNTRINYNILRRKRSVK